MGITAPPPVRKSIQVMLPWITQATYLLQNFFDVRKVTVATGIITTIAASNTGTSLTAQNVFVDQSGNVYISDYGHSRVYELDSSLHSIAGTGSLGISGDGGPATSAQLFYPGRLFVDASGNIYISSESGIREIVQATGNIQTVIGNGAFGFSGDGGPATNAQLFYPLGIAVDSSGNIFIEDIGNHRIREFVASTGIA